MKKLIQYIVLIFLISAVVLTVVDFMLEHGLLKQKEDVFGKLNEVFHGKENYNVLFLGSSRTLVHVNPLIIDSVLKVNSYNAGFDGINIIESKMFLDSYLEHHPAPRLLVLTIDIGSLAINDTTKLFDFPLYFPYLKDGNVKNTLSEFLPQTKWISTFPFLKPAYYDDFKKYMAIKAAIRPGGDKKNILYKGFAPKEMEWKGEELHTRFQIHNSKHGLDLLKQVLNICSENKIKCAIVYAPQTAELTERIDNFNDYLNLLKQTCDDYNIPFLNYSEIPITNDKKYFYNHLHLNSEGANIYSELLANDLKNLFKGN
jgi:hypothetical protein